MSIENFMRFSGIIMAMVWCISVTAQSLEDEYDWYPTEAAGWGLCAEKISGDEFRDIFTTRPYGLPYVYGATWFNRAPEFPAQFELGIESISSGYEAKFGQLRMDNPVKDLVITSVNYDGMKIYLNDNDGSLTHQQTFINYDINRISWGNVDGNGWDDLVGAHTSGYWEPNVYIYINNNGTLIEPEEGMDTGSYINKLEVADLHFIWNYGLHDLIIASMNQIKVYANDGFGSFYLVQEFYPGGTPPPSDIFDFETGDMNSDGYIDLVLSAGDLVYVYFNTGNGTFDEENFDTFAYAGLGAQEVAIGEYNYDGYPDVAYIMGFDYGYVFLNQGDGTFPNIPVWSAELPNGGGSSKELFFEDLTGTGAMSLIGAVYWGIQTGFYIFKDISDPPPCPPKNFTVVEGENNHPLLKWAPNSEPDFDVYNIYRQIGRPEGPPPPLDQFSCIATTDETEYLDTEIQVHMPMYNCRVWYYITAVDNGLNESLSSDIIDFLALYHPQGGSEGDAEELVGTSQPGRFSLSAAPNPFNPNTMISYDLPEAAAVRLKIYNISGCMVASLVNSWQNEGIYEVIFNGVSLPSGVYIYRFDAGKFSDTGKLVLMK